MKSNSICIADLTEENLHELPEWESHPFSCRYCTYWEFPEECEESAKEQKEDKSRRKLQWIRKTRKAFGNCGKIVYLDSKAIGYAQYAAPELLPNCFNYSAGSPSKDAALISCLFIILKKFPNKEIGSNLLINIIDDLKSRCVKAIETFARKGSPANPSGPMKFYLKHGFRIYNDDPEFPLMRIDLPYRN